MNLLQVHPPCSTGTPDRAGALLLRAENWKKSARLMIASLNTLCPPSDACCPESPACRRHHVLCTLHRKLAAQSAHTRHEGIKEAPAMRCSCSQEAGRAQGSHRGCYRGSWARVSQGTLSIALSGSCPQRHASVVHVVQHVHAQLRTPCEVFIGVLHTPCWPACLETFAMHACMALRV